MSLAQKQPEPDFSDLRHAPLPVAGDSAVLNADALAFLRDLHHRFGPIIRGHNGMHIGHSLWNPSDTSDTRRKAR